MTHDDWMQNFSENLLDLLIEKKMSQRDLAKATGLSAGSINAYVNKQSPPGYKAIINIAYALDVDVADLIDFGDTIN